jgi:DNA modification methylase
MPSTTTAAREASTPSTRRKGGGSGRNGLGVFGANKTRPFHRWYPFVEGYSADLVERALSEQATPGTVLDPFGGSGTTALAAAMLGRDSVFAEVNPYMAWVADVKINRSRQVAEDGTSAELRALATELAGTLPPANEDHPLLIADRRRGYFPQGVAEQAISVHALIDKALTGSAREVARLALGSSLVPSSNMVRRTDLRKRVANDPAPHDLLATLGQHLLDFAHDVDNHADSIQGTVKHIAGDVRDKWIEEPEVSVVVTSPPYLNGTNYCRNTKLELLTLGFIESERDLTDLRVSMISAGINNVSKRRIEAAHIDCVEHVAQKLDEVAYDVRIPALVRTYFSDMKGALSQIRRHAVEGARMYFDIGDSRYSGVHVPTHSILRQIAEDEGWHFLDEEVLRTRRSYDGSELTQVLMRFEAV